MKSLLCLGDSYTIGEAVPEEGSFPFQLVEQLNKMGYSFLKPEILAKTGWTTQETLDAMALYKFKEQYDWVTVLSGVNNQYRGCSLESYVHEFSSLLHWALQLAGGNRQKVVVLSIPDWGCTPFAHARDTEKISLEIDRFNAENRRLASQMGFSYIDICEGSRKAKENSALVANDGLHPSPLEYARWANLLSKVMAGRS